MTIEHNEIRARAAVCHIPNRSRPHRTPAYGYRPFQDEPDPRPLPEARTVANAVADIFDALIATLSETRL